MRVAVLRETTPGERRVALVPEAVSRLGQAGFNVVVERGAGAEAGFVDEAYAESGATLVDAAAARHSKAPWSCVRTPSPEETRGPAARHRGHRLPRAADGLGRARTAAPPGVVAFAMESIPRITRAQPMDALSSQATISGYKAALLGADRVPKLFPLLMTAAGTIAPARVLVLGAGVAGLQAIATHGALGAVVSAFDVRPAVKEQVESLGATFLELGVRAEETAGGYATELSPEEQARQQEALEEHIASMDVVITTALVPGRPAPKLIPAAAVRRMRPGSVVVDLAAETGGNCELTVPGEEVVREGVTIVGLTNVPSLVPSDASRLYARNVSALLEHLRARGRARPRFR